MRKPRQTGLMLNNETGDLLLTNGRLTVGDTLYQNQYVILQTQPGEFKTQPMFGVAIENMLGDDNVEAWKKTIRDLFERDELKVKKVKIDVSTNVVEIDAVYE